MKKSLTFWNILPVLLIISGILLLIFRVLIKKRGESQTTTSHEDEFLDVEPIDDEPEPSKEQRIRNHYSVIRKSLPEAFTDDVAKMITAHSMHETGIFTSRLYREQNNLFGMRHPVIRQTLSMGERDTYATYASLEDSVKDFILYLDEFKEPRKYAKISDYVSMLKNNGYFTADYLPYFNAVRSHYNKVKELVQ